MLMLQQGGQQGEENGNAAAAAAAARRAAILRHTTSMRINSSGGGGRRTGDDIGDGYRYRRVNRRAVKHRNTLTSIELPTRASVVGGKHSPGGRAAGGAYSPYQTYPIASERRTMSVSFPIDESSMRQLGNDLRHLSNSFQSEVSTTTLVLIVFEVDGHNCSTRRSCARADAAAHAHLLVRWTGERVAKEANDSGFHT